MTQAVGFSSDNDCRHQHSRLLGHDAGRGDNKPKTGMKHAQFLPGQCQHRPRGKLEQKRATGIDEQRGISIAFGILDIVNIAHPAFIILGSYIAYIVNTSFGLDPILVCVVMLPAFYLLGAAVYQVYYVSFERRGQEALRGLAFFFGLLFITEVALILAFGVDYRYVGAAYIGPTLHVGFVDLPLRMLVPCLVSLLLILVLQVYLTRTFIGRAIMAVAQDQEALRLMAADPIRIKRIAFGISIATAALAGVFLIVIQPVEPSVGREYIGRVFAICVMGGMGSMPGTVIAAFLLGIVESLTATFYGPSWAPAVSFGFLLLTLAFRPAGILGR
jgi:branched-chain amino acid transport system permease protein